MAYLSWSNSGFNPNAPQFSTCSANLRELNHYIAQRWGGISLGCKNVRTIAGSSSLSSHAFGAAIDIRLPNEPNRLYAVAFMMDHFDQLGLNAIHDYRRQMIYKDDHAWHSASIGSLGGDWWHVETKLASYDDGRSVDEKIGQPPPPPPPPTPGYDPWHHLYADWPTRHKVALSYGFGYTNGTQQYQEMVQYFNHVVAFEAGQSPSNPLTVFGPGSISAVRNLNAFFNGNGANRGFAEEAWNGACGIECWKVIDFLASRPR